MTSVPLPKPGGEIVHPSVIPFLLIHVACFAAIASGVTWRAFALGMGLYWLRMFAVTGGYHRYFSHRSYSTGRAFQFVLAFLAQSAGQKSVLWWASKHRHHHLHSDTENDLHSPTNRGFLYSHVGWILDRKNDPTEIVKVEDLARYPELRWLHRYEAIPPMVFAIICFLVAGWPGVIVGFCWSTVAVYHATFCINSLAHVRGSKRYVTGDQSRNNLMLAIATMGEGWHNNHHACQSSARQGFRWWEIDLTYYILRTLAALGIVWDLKSPPAAVLRNEHHLGARVLHRAAEGLAASFDPLATAREIQRCSAEASVAARPSAPDHEQTADIPTTLPKVPDRQDFVRRAQQLFARTPSLDDIVDRARELFFSAIAEHLARTSYDAASMQWSTEHSKAG